MAGVGRPPKPNRRNRNPLARGEWVELAVIADPVVPELPEAPDTGPWSSRTEAAWRSWWCDPASQMWQGSDLDLVNHLAYLHEFWVIKKRTSMLSEMRHVRESLGLTPKGKQDRRWKVAPPAEVVNLQEKRTASEKMKELHDRAAAAERVT